MPKGIRGHPWGGYPAKGVRRVPVGHPGYPCPPSLEVPGQGYPPRIPFAPPSRSGDSRSPSGPGARRSGGTPAPAVRPPYPSPCCCLAAASVRIGAGQRTIPGESLVSRTRGQRVGTDPGQVAPSAPQPASPLLSPTIHPNVRRPRDQLAPGDGDVVQVRDSSAGPIGGFGPSGAIVSPVAILAGIAPISSCHSSAGAPSWAPRRPSTAWATMRNSRDASR